MRRYRPRGRQAALYILLVIFVLTVMALIRNCGPANALSPQRHGNSQGDTLDVAVIYGPGSYFLKGDTLSGVNYELLSQLRDSFGWKLRMWPVVSRTEALQGIDAGQYDILASLPSDNELKTSFLTTSDVFLDRLVLIQRDTDPARYRVKSALDLAGDTVYVEEASPAHRRMQNLIREIGDTIHIIPVSGMGEEYIAMKVGSGEWRYGVVNQLTATQMHRGRYPHLDSNTPVSFTQFQVWVVRRDNVALQQRIDSMLRILGADGTLDRIRTRADIGPR